MKRCSFYRSKHVIFEVLTTPKNSTETTKTQNCKVVKKGLCPVDV